MNEATILPILLGEFQDKLALLQSLTPRQTSFPYAPDKIKVAIGMRRSGKTYFLYQNILALLANGIPLSQILYINFEDDRLLPLTRTKLANLIDAFYTLYPENHDQKCYLFLDEIHNVEDWALVVRRLHDSKRAEIFLTGSSAKLLSKEIASSLRGRSLSTEIWPFSFKEFLIAKKLVIDTHLFDKKTQDKLTKYFHEYLTIGGFPEVTNYETDVRQATLQSYIDIVIYRDIVERHNIQNTAVVKYMILNMLHNTSNFFSINKFFNDLKSQGYKVGKDMLYQYADYIEDSYLSFLIKLYDKSIRKVQTNPYKLYAVDSGMIRAVTLNHTGDLGKLFENIIYLELRRQNWHIYYYLTQERYEVDFLVENNKGDRKLLQVVWDMENKTTYDRELRALEAAKKELGIPGVIITLDSYLRSGLPT